MINNGDLKAQLFTENLRKFGYGNSNEDINERDLSDLVSQSSFADKFISRITNHCTLLNFIDNINLKYFIELQDKNIPILSQNHIDLIISSDVSISDEDLRKHIVKLENENKNIEIRNKNLEWEIQLLGKEQNKIDVLSGETNYEKMNNANKLLETVEITSYQVNKCNNSMKEIVYNIIDSFNSKYNKGKIDIANDIFENNLILFSNIDLSYYEQIEKELNQELIKYMNKSMIKNVKKMAKSIRTLMKCELININDLVTDNDNIDIYSSSNISTLHQSEFKRLRLVMPETELLKMQAMEKELFAKIGLEFTRKYRENWNETKSLPISVDQLLKLLYELEPKCAEIQRKLISYSRKKIPSIINKSSELQVNSVISGNYNLVICRQQYCILLQKKVIENLLQQKSRGELINLLFDYQYESFTKIYKTIAAICFTIKQKKSQYMDRMISLKKDAYSNNEIIRNKDILMTSIYNILDFNKKETPTLSHCLENSNNLRNRLAVINDLTECQFIHIKTKYLQFTKQMNKMGIIKSNYTKCTAEIVDFLKNMECRANYHEEQATVLFKSITDKQKLISSNKFQAYSRRIFELFILDQEKLRVLMKRAEENYKTTLKHR